MSHLRVSPAKSRRQLRERKQQALYADDFPLEDDDKEIGRGFSVAEKLESDRFAQLHLVREMIGEHLTIKFLQAGKFNMPLLFHNKEGLGLVVPDDTFTVKDIRRLVGSKRKVDVMDVNTQKNLIMTMKEWQDYYDNPNKTKLLNVISLEFSHTSLDNYVQSPTIVRQCDWVDVVWPRELKDAQVDETNVLQVMKYPKVQKYCLMSVKNCYTDFHVDFGGTSVWYHIVRGSKVFWLIRPTPRNLKLYEKWVLSGKQSTVFFGDTVDECVRVFLQAGNTFFIPSGWIHAVYTPHDSIVFGGNFLHSFGIRTQLRIAKVEDTLRVQKKFRYPFFIEMLWYVLAKYVYALLGRSHLVGVPGREDEVARNQHVYVTEEELFGLKEIVIFLYALPHVKKNVPDRITDAVALIRDLRSVVEHHFRDNLTLSLTGVPILQAGQCVFPPAVASSEAAAAPSSNGHEVPPAAAAPGDEAPVDLAGNAAAAAAPTPPQAKQPAVADSAQPVPANGACVPSIATPSAFVQPQATVSNRTGPRGPYKKHKDRANGGGDGSASGQADTPHRVNGGAGLGGGGGGAANVPRRRRTRCKTCAACQRSDCGECSFCLDMVKFGGPGRAKQTCTMRQCLQPMLPITAQCILCHLDGWRQTPVTPQAKQQAHQEGPSELMECSVCYEITHPDCNAKALKAQPNASDAAERSGVKNEDLPNSWECPTCCSSGKNSDYKPRHFRARQSTSEVRRVSVGPDGGTGVASQALNGHGPTEPSSPHHSSSAGAAKTTPTIIKSEATIKSEAMDTCKPYHALQKDHQDTGSTSGLTNGVHQNPPSNPAACADDDTDNPISCKRRKSEEKPQRSSATSTNDAVSSSAAAKPAPLTNSATATVAPVRSSATPATQHSLPPRKRNSLRNQLASQIIASSTKPMKKPLYVVRPGSLATSVSAPNGALVHHTPAGANLAQNPVCMMAVFRYLPTAMLVTCSLVCKTWSTLCVDPKLWKRMDCTQNKLSSSLLAAIVRRQPEELVLDWTQVAKRQLAWIVTRIPALKQLSLQGIGLNAVHGLHTCLCPPLQVLDLSFVQGLGDATVRDILSPPKDSRPGLSDSKSRLRNLKKLKLAGTEISDVALLYVTQGAPSLVHLDLSTCQRITDAGVAQIGTCNSAINTLVELNLNSCKLVTESCLEYLSKCEALTWLDLRNVPQVSTQAVIKFAARSKHNLHVRDVKLVDRRRVDTPI